VVGNDELAIVTFETWVKVHIFPPNPGEKAALKEASE